jgi:nicotinamidase-related amidase
MNPSPTRHPALLRAEDSLLVVVDMQEPFLRHVWERERVLKKAATLIQAAAILHVPVVATTQNAQRMGGPVPEVAALLPPGAPFDKMSFSCAAESGFALDLRRRGHRQVILCGVETHICVSQTAHDLITQGYQVHIVADAVSSRSERDWQTGLRRMEQRAGIIITSTEMAIYELLFQAGTPEFREVLKLIK